MKSDNRWEKCLHRVYAKAVAVVGEEHDQKRILEAHVESVVEVKKNGTKGWKNTISCTAECIRCGNITYPDYSKLSTHCFSGCPCCRGAAMRGMPRVDHSDEIGKVYGTWKIISIDHRPYNDANKNMVYYATCECMHCGEQKEIQLYRVKNGTMPECACAILSFRGVTVGKFSKHPITSGLYFIWADYNLACYSNTHRAYLRTGALGIRVCPEWKRDPEHPKDYAPFIRFCEWSYAHGYDPDRTANGRRLVQMHRYDMAGDFSPDNCYYKRISGYIMDRVEVPQTV